MRYVADVMRCQDPRGRTQRILARLPKNAKPNITRFKGLGEMPAKQLRDTTMDPQQRTLLRVTLPEQTERGDYKKTVKLVESLMGRKPELRFDFIQKNAKFVRDLDV